MVAHADRDQPSETFEKAPREKVDVVFDLIGGDTQERSFLVMKRGGHLVAAAQPVSQDEAARRRVSGVMMRLTPSTDRVGRIARLLEEGTIRHARRLERLGQPVVRVPVLARI